MEALHLQRLSQAPITTGLPLCPPNGIPPAGCETVLMMPQMDGGSTLVTGAIVLSRTRKPTPAPLKGLQRTVLLDLSDSV